MTQTTIWNPALIRPALKEAVLKLNPKTQIKNPVMFLVEVGSAITTLAFAKDLLDQDRAAALFSGQISVWLWFTVLFANFAEAMAEGRGKAQAENLRKSRTETSARRITSGGSTELIPSSQLRKGDRVLVAGGEVIPADGTVIEGVASVDESAITGESAPVIREAGGDRSAVTGGTTVLSDEIRIEISTNPGESFLDRMISLVEGAVRQKTPNEIALNILLIGLTLVFLMATLSLKPFAMFAKTPVSIVTLCALLVCLIPTTIGGLLSAIGIAGMDRLVQRNVLALSGRAVEAAGDVDVLLLDKTGTITMGNRMAHEFIPEEEYSQTDIATTALLASTADLTPEGRSIVTLARRNGIKTAQTEEPQASINGAEPWEPVPFSAESRMSGINTATRQIRKGALDSVQKWIEQNGGDSISQKLSSAAKAIANSGGTPLLVAENSQAIGLIHLKDVIKPGIRDRFERIRAMGIKTIMVTGDNRLTAAAIAKESGVDDYLAEAKPEDKLRLIKSYQTEGRMVAMSGDGTNDAPALAQSDVGLVMNTGTQAAREAGNMIDLDSDPTKLIEIVEIGKQLLITRGALTTFSIANDVSKYFAIIPAMFMSTMPALAALNIMGLKSPQSAILSAVIFNAVVIVFLIPLALRGVEYRPQSATKILTRNILVYGLGGIAVPFAGIKLIDILISSLGLI